jgi:Ca2+/H+ antiporter, TMEM165/GDT1 family
VEAFLVSTAIAALAEIGDKSPLPVLKLAARFRKPLPIILGILGILAAALLNHVAAAELGAWLGLAVVALLEVVR